MDKLEAGLTEWGRLKREWVEKTNTPDRGPNETPSGILLRPIYTPLDLEDHDYIERLGFPGIYPYTRGIYPTMYRGRPWTIRMISGHGDTVYANERTRFLLQEGSTGINLVLDSPTIYGYDSDDPKVRGEVGQGGAPISSLQDMEAVFQDVPLDRVSTSLITHFIGMHVFAMYAAMADGRGISRSQLRGTTQDDPLWFFHVANPPLPLRPAIKLAVDLLEFCVKEMPRWYAINVCGYHMREAGATAIQEATFTLADAIVYIDEALKRGLDINEVAPKVSFFLNSHNDLFEEVAKFRAMRRVWAKILKEKYRSKYQLFKFHVQTSGVALTAQDPLNNVVRTTIHALGAIVGGCQSLHTDAYDEALAPPTLQAQKIALRTQQILLHENGVASVIDPLGGSYYVEWLTDEVESSIWRYFDEIESAGGMIEYTEKQIPRREITNNSYLTQLAIEQGDRPVVGVNLYPGRIEDIAIDRVTLEQESRQIERVRVLKKSRDNITTSRALESLREACLRGVNVTPYVIASAKAYATTGEIYGIFREIYGIQPPFTIF